MPPVRGGDNTPWLMMHSRHPERISQMLIQDSGLPNRPRRRLQMVGIRTVADLLRRTEQDLLTIDHFGQTSLAHVKRFLKRHNLQLDRERPQQLDRERVRAGLRDRGCNLARREREILKLRYGLANGRRLTLEQTGRLFDLTRERVRQIQKHAEAKVATRLAFKPNNRTDP